MKEEKKFAQHIQTILKKKKTRRTQKSLLAGRDKIKEK